MERELWRIISQTITAVDRRISRGRYTHSVGRIVRMYLWSALHDRPVYWACRKANWSGVRRPCSLPDQSRLSRRLRQQDTQDFIREVLSRLNRTGRIDLVKYIDGKPLPIARHSQDPDSTIGRGAGGFDRGYKLHAIYGQSGRLITWRVHPLNVDERTVARTLVRDLTDEGYLLADGNYDANHLYESAHEHGHQLIAPRRYGPHRGLGHHRHAPQRRRGIDLLEGPSEFGRILYRQRRQIETKFGNLSSFGGGLICLPPWVRTLARVRLLVDAKLLIRAAMNHLIKNRAA